MNRREWLKRITWFSVVFGMIGIIVGSFFYSDPNSPNWNPNDDEVERRRDLDTANPRGEATIHCTVALRQMTQR